MVKYTSEELFISFNNTMAIWMDCCNSYSLEQLRTKPAADSWSIGQMIRHIIVDTGFHIEQIKAALNDQQLTHNMMHPDGMKMLQRNEFPDMRIAGHPNNAFIAQPESKEELIYALQDLQEELNKLKEEFDFDAASGKSQHPGLGYFSAREWLQFTGMHMRHHLRQKKRIDDYMND